MAVINYYATYFNKPGSCNHLLPEFLDRRRRNVRIGLGVVEDVEVVLGHVVGGVVTGLGVPPAV